MALCPDNSTACLLRALLQDNTTKQILQNLNDSSNEYNWDPITFGFTVAIGVLAFVVACVTVFQQLIAAGPGRIKANSVAIGPWAVHSNSGIDWREFRMRTTAYTASINIGNLSRFLDKHQESEEEEEVEGKEDEGRRPLQEKLSLVLPDHHSRPRLTGQRRRWRQSEWDAGATLNASWATLLTRLGLGDPVLWRNDNLRYDPEFWPGLACKTDYLPSDIQAAPTRGGMKSVVFLAALANDTCSLEPAQNSRLILVRGHTSDLSARYHDLMGPVFIFECFGEPGSFFSRLQRLKDEKIKVIYPTVRDVVDANKLCHGVFKCGDAKIEVSHTGNFHQISTELRRSFGGIGPVLWDQIACPLFFACSVGQVIFRPRLFPKSARSTNLIHAVRQLSLGSMWQEEAPLEFVKHFRSFSAMIHGLDEPEATRLDWIFKMKKRRSPFLRINADEFELNRKMREMGAWMGSTWMHDKRTNAAERPEDEMLHGSFDWEAKVNIASIVYSLTRTIHHHEPDNQDHQRSIIETQRRDRKKTFVMQLLAQYEIFCIDEWLHRRAKDHDGRDVYCALLTLLKVVKIRSRENKRVGDGDGDGDAFEGGMMGYGAQAGLRRGGQRRGRRRGQYQGQHRGQHQGQRQRQAGASSSSSSDDRDLLTRFPLPPKACNEAYIETRVPAPANGDTKNSNNQRHSSPTASSDDDSDNDNNDNDDDTATFSLDPEDRPTSSIRYSKNRSESDRKEIWLLVEVLRYRALLFAAVLDLCADSTCLTESENFVAKIL